MHFTRLKIDHEDDIATLALNRPDVRNAFDSGLVRELADAFTALGKDKKVRAIILKGEGKVFCAGADIGWMRASMDLSEDENKKDAEQMAGMLRTIDECPKPVIGRVHRAAMGGGAGLVACCDIVVASEETKFAFSEVKLGILPAVISSFVLPKIGESNARRYFLTAEVFTAATARVIGLIHEVVPTTDDLDAKVKEIVTTVRNNGPMALLQTKKLIHEVRSMPRDERIPFCAHTTARVRVSPEGQEGLRAFLDKRPPKWMNR